MSPRAQTLLTFAVGIAAGATVITVVNRARGAQARRALAEAGAAADTRPQLQQISRNLVDMCHDLEPALLELERSLDDRNIGPADAARIFGHVRSLTR